MEAQRSRARDSSQLSGDVFAGGFVDRAQGREAARRRSSSATSERHQSRRPRARPCSKGEERPRVSRRLCEAQGRVLVVDRESLLRTSPADRSVTAAWQTATRPAGRILGCTKQDDYWLHELVGRGGLSCAVGDEIEMLSASTAYAAGTRSSATTRRRTCSTQALKDVLGEHVSPGRLPEVAPDRLRFDFTHGERLSARAGSVELERIVAREVMAATQLAPRPCPLSDAKGARLHRALRREVRRRGADPRDRSSTARSSAAAHTWRTRGSIGAFRIVTESSGRGRCAPHRGR